MEDWILIVAGALILLPLAAPYILGPLLVKATQRVKKQPRFEDAGLAAGADLPPVLRAFFEQTRRDLRAAGFHPLRFLMQSEQTPKVTLLLELHHNPAKDDYALALVAIGKTAEGVEDIQQRVVEFAAALSDDRVIATNDRDDPDALPIPPHKDVARLPQLRGRIGELYAVHRARVEALRGAARPIALCAPGGEAEALAAAMARDYAYGVEIGYYAERGEDLTATWKGACLMTWGLCWPIVSLRKAAIRHRARRYFLAKG